jgi:hypothetical protein
MLQMYLKIKKRILFMGYTYGDELSDNETKSNLGKLGKLGKIIASFVLIWCFKTCMATAIDNYN